MPGSTDLADAAARYLYKVMAYKDEYEVARLYTNGDWIQAVRNTFKGHKKIRFHLAPPLLSRVDAETGLPAKREFGAWILGPMKLLARLKFLRGGRFDLFGRSEERRRERALIDRYRATLTDLCESLTPENHDLAVEIASIPDQIRGYGHVKLASLNQVEARWDDLLDQFRFARGDASPAQAA